MKINYRYSFLLFIAISVLMISACSGDSSSSSDEEETYNLRISSGDSESHGVWVGFYKPWMEKVEEETDGRVTFEAFTSGELVEYGEELDAVKEGIIDIAAPLLPIGDPGKFPLSEVAMLPLDETSPEIGSASWNALMESDVVLKDDKTFSELEFGDEGLKALAPTISEEYSLATIDSELNTPESLKGLKIRVPSRIHEIFANRVGMGTVRIPSSDLYDALSRGTIDGSFSFIGDWSSFGYDDLFKHAITDINLGHYSAVFAFSQEKWDSLPEDIQEIMVNAQQDLVVEGSDVWVDRTKDVMKEAEEKGTEFIEIDDLNPDVEKLFKESAEETWFEYADILNEQGHPGDELIKLWRDIVIEQGGSVPSAIEEL